MSLLMNKTWEKTYSGITSRNKNMYPNEDLVSFINRNFEKKCNLKVLDLGCGWGNNLKFMSDYGLNVYGIEQSKTAYNYCKKKFRNVFNGNFSNLTKFNDNFFDIIIDRQSLQHNNRSEILKIIFEINRVLKPKGILYSHLICKANYNYLTYYFTKEKIKTMFNALRIINLIKIKRSSLIKKNNDLSYFILEAQKK